MTKKIPPDLKKFHEEINLIFMNKIPVSDIDFEKYAFKDVMGYGTTKDEFIKNIHEYQDFIQSQEIQGKDLDMSFSRNPIHHHLSEDGNSALIVEEIEISLTVDDTANTFSARLSLIMEKIKEEWKLIHWHASVPVDTENDAWHVKEWEREKEKLEALVAEQTTDLLHKNRELEIETALERVRSQSMAMHHTSELQQVIHTVHEELLGLGIGINGGSFIAINQEIDQEIRCWGAGGTADTSNEVHIPAYDKPFYTNILNRLKGEPGLFTEEFDQEQKKEFFKFLLEHEPWSQLSEKEKKEVLSAEGGYTRSCCVGNHVSIFIINHFGKAFSEEENEILKRFTKVFEQAYTRFLDLQKAESQARESEIQLALERVRARTMAMHKSDELKDVVAVLFKNFKELSIPATAVGIGIAIPGSKDLNAFVCGENEDGLVITNYRLPFFDNIISKDLCRSLDKQEDYFVGHYSIAEKNSFYSYLFEHSAIKDVPDDIKEMIFESPSYTISMVTYNNAVFNINDFEGNTLSDSEIDIIKRFAKVFDQTYTRFHDLQKAETQAREAQIETSLEKIRTRTMAMQKGEEMQEVVVLLYKELIALGVTNFVTCGYVEVHEESGRQDTWVTSPGGDTFGLFHLPLTGDATFDARYAAWKNQEPVFHQTVAGQVRSDHLEYAITKFNSKEAEEMVRSQFPDPTVFYCFNFSHGYLHTVGGSLLEKEEEELLARFTKVFEQTYTRFLDLQRAEAQARENEIQLALERVRARTMAMQHSNELQDAAMMLFQQVETLGIPVFGCGFNIWDTDRKAATSWMAGKDRLQPSFKTSSSEDIFLRIHEAAQNGDSLFVEEQSEKALEAHYKYMASIPTFKEVMDKMADDGQSVPSLQFMHCAFFSHGYLMFISFEPVPDAHDIFKRFAKVFEQTYTRFLDLKKAEAQARDAEINLAVERVRAKALAMFKSEEIIEVVNKLKEEIMGLNIPSVTAATIHLSEPDGKIRVWDLTSIEGDENNLDISLDISYHPEDTHPDFFMREVWDRTEDYFVVIQTKDRYEHTVDWLQQHGYAEQARDFEDYIEETGMEKVYHPTVPLQKGRMSIDVLEEPAPEVESILKKMAKAFDLAYKRFEDLQNAEAQAREAQVETALEKVRSRSLAMQQSDELNEVAFVLFEQLRNLGGELWGTGFGFCKKDSNVDEFWFANETGILPPVHAPNTDDPAHKLMYEGWKENKDYVSISMAGKELEAHYEYMLSLPEVKPFFQEILDSGLSFPKQQQWNAAYFKQGYLLLITTEDYPYPGVLKRFAKVFEQSYTRFLDLQRAEAQAREAQIEAALEKIRSRTMGMQNSEELPQVANLLFLEVQGLGINAWSCGYCILRKDGRSSTCIMSSEGTIQKPFTLPHVGESSFEEWDDFIQGEDTFIVQELEGKAIKSHYDFMMSLPQLAPVFQDLQDEGLTLPSYQINHLSKFSNGFLLFITYEKVPDAHNIFKRFTSVFDQTYTRFLDLKKSEKRARAAEVELSLERVRAQVTAMQKSSDLFDIVVNMRNEFISLGHEADYFWHMRWLADSYEMSMTSDDGSRIGMVISIPKHVHDEIPALAEWEKGNDPIYILALNADDAWDYIENMNTHGHYEQADPNAPTQEDIQQLGGLTFILARTTHGEIGYSMPGVVNNPPSEALDTLKRFAGVFGLAYQRFEDLKEAERQAQLILEERDRLELTLNELHATQDQLIQQEKLASLGQLTAGIAHEIKNPLNFVNNFSDLSVELIQEALEELKKFPSESEELDELLADIASNLRKIHDHGSRADNIVKSMLQHSRGGTGKMEPTPLNDLLKEYANLAYHGMRASKDPIKVDLHFELDDDIGDISLITEDFSRVLVNLCNNAFDAMREKLKSEDYKPLLTVRSHQADSEISIEIEDNGPGIPEEIKGQILQPFFTTKKGTEGTGLGLSITNDIIKAHGGDLEIESNKDSHTICRIILKSDK